MVDFMTHGIPKIDLKRNDQIGDISMLTNLTYLDLGYNYHLIDDISTLTNLTELYLVYSVEILQDQFNVLKTVKQVYFY
jgi:Leucine-rich repeat (LRR) protein